jgi:Uma2 family endonuclease
MHARTPYHVDMSAARHRPSRMSAEDLFHYDMPGKRTELVRGRLVVRDLVGVRHSVVAAKLVTALSIWVARHPIGFVLAGYPGFVLERDPDTVRGPDVAFVRANRGLIDTAAGFAELAPDLAIEVRSPSDRLGALEEKVRQWLAAGTRLVWVIEPERRLARVFRPDGSSDRPHAADVLDGEDVLPGFSLKLSEVL